MASASKTVTEVTLNAELPLAAQISIRRESRDCETFDTMKRDNNRQNSENKIFEKKNETFVEKYRASHLCTRFEGLILINQAVIVKRDLSYFWL